MAKTFVVIPDAIIQQFATYDTKKAAKDAAALQTTPNSPVYVLTITGKSTAGAPPITHEDFEEVP